MDFPLVDLVDQDDCYVNRVALFHPGELACSACKADDSLRVHRRHRTPVLAYCCHSCHRVYNAVAGKSGEGRLEVVDSTGPAELGEIVDRSCLFGTRVNTDACAG